MSFLISKFEYDYLSERKRTNRHARGERVWRRGDGAHHGIHCVVVVVVICFLHSQHRTSTRPPLPPTRATVAYHSFHEDETLDNNSRTSDYRSS